MSHKMDIFMSFFSKVFGDHSSKIIREYERVVKAVNAREAELETAPNEELLQRSYTCKDQARSGVSLDELMPEAFALVREVGKRTHGKRFFDVQLIGAAVLHQGAIAELKTGEGKSIAVIPLAAYLNALAGKGVHVVTVNDYLSKRDAVSAGMMMAPLGVSVGCIVHEASYLFTSEVKSQKSKAKSEADQVTLSASSRVDMDFLKPVSRKEAYAADVTFGTNNEFGFDYLRDNMAPARAAMVQRNLVYAIVDEIDSILIDEARTPLIISSPAAESTDRYYTFANIVKTLKENEDYNVDEKMRAATLTESGLATIEKTLGISNMYVAESFELIRHLEAALKAEVLFKRDRDYVVKEGHVVIVDEFTGRLMPGRRYSEGLHQALEAKEGVAIERESKTLATVTFQNYFRMYEKLAGTSGTVLTESEEFYKIYSLESVAIPTHMPMIREDMPDRIYKTEDGKFQALVEDIQARHRLGQPVLVGTISIEKNELVSALLTRRGVPHEVLNAKNHEREAEIIAQAGKVGAVTVATNMAGRGVDILLGGNPVNAREAEVVRTLGGLHVIGTERHEARRIDNQLRGRAGRQGDPGSSQFYLSLEDDIMRIFGGSRVKSIMDRLGVPEDVPIENRMVSKSVETAQKKVESHHFDIRKHLLEYDDVINKHREVMYKKRRRVLEVYEKEAQSSPHHPAVAGGTGHRQSAEEAESQNEGAQGQDSDSLKEEILSYIRKEIEDIVGLHTAKEGAWNLDEVYESMDTLFPVPLEVRLKLEHFPGEKVDAKTHLIEYVFSLARGELENRLTKANAALTSRTQEVPDIDLFREISRSVILQSMDQNWMDHIDAMDSLRTGIGIRGYGQRDPLIEYKREAYRMFTQLLAQIQHQIAYGIFKLFESGIAVRPFERTFVQQPLIMHGAAKTSDEIQESGVRSQESGMKQPGQVTAIPPQADPQYKKVGRNDPCPCGSGKKFKKCHGG